VSRVHFRLSVSGRVRPKSLNESLRFFWKRLLPVQFARLLAILCQVIMRQRLELGKWDLFHIMQKKVRKKEVHKNPKIFFS